LTVLFLHATGIFSPQRRLYRVAGGLYLIWANHHKREAAMNKTIDRRDFLKLAGIGGAVFASGLPGCANMGQAAGQPDF
jgi:hypothetical protein